MMNLVAMKAEEELMTDPLSAFNRTAQWVWQPMKFVARWNVTLFLLGISTSAVRCWVPGITALANCPFRASGFFIMSEAALSFNNMWSFVLVQFYREYGWGLYGMGTFRGPAKFRSSQTFTMGLHCVYQNHLSIIRRLLTPFRRTVHVVSCAFFIRIRTIGTEKNLVT
jgi:hypothetical protein